MRKNQPVTDIEHKVKPGDILVSRTNTKGIIIYANRAFCDIAGYKQEEMVGQPHNIVRHPDMPPAAFQDLWDTVSDEKPWTGIVKNRCANGDYYWVVANVSPEYDSSGRVNGYVSVRTAPTQEQIDAISALYQDVNLGKVECPRSNDYPFWNRIKIKTLMLASAAVASIGLLWFGYSLLSIQDETLIHAQHRADTTPYLTAVRGVLEYLPQHRGMGNAYLKGKTDLANKLADTRQKINAALEKLHTVDEAASFLNLSGDLQVILSDWKQLESEWGHLGAVESFKRHSEIIKRLMELDSDAMHHGELTTSPEINLAHYAEYLAEGIPELNELMGRLRGLGSGIATSGKITSVQRDKLLHLFVGGEIARDGVVASIEHVIHVYDPGFREHVGDELRLARDDTEAFFKMVQEDLLDAKAISVDAKAYFAAGTAAIASSLKLFDAVDATLSLQLAERVKEEKLAYVITLISTVVLVLLAIALIVLMMRRTFSPLQEIVRGMQRITEGNYSQMVVKAADDEFGDIIDDMKTMQSRTQYEIFETKIMNEERMAEQREQREAVVTAEKRLADDFETHVGTMVNGLAEEVGQVQEAATTLNHISEGLARESAGANEGVSTSTHHVTSTAAAIEEMSASVAEVSRRIQETQSISTQAVREASSASEMMERLAAASSEIGSVVATISEIAEQTNLLALNASIEAARAGDAGRGFAVVAGEVKELATQTSQATEQIRKQIDGIQSESQAAKGAIEMISETIHQMDDHSQGVATAMSEQSAATHEISDGAQQANMSMHDVQSSVNDLVSASGEIDHASTQMSALSDSMAARAADVQSGIAEFVGTLRNRH